VDINVFVEDDGLEQVFDTLEDLGIDVDRDAAATDHRARGMFVVRSDEGIRIDVFTPSIEFSWEAAKTAPRQTVLGTEVSVLSAEALSVFKLLFFRSKDIADLERLVATQGDRLDAARSSTHTTAPSRARRLQRAGRGPGSERPVAPHRPSLPGRRLA